MPRTFSSLLLLAVLAAPAAAAQTAIPGAAERALSADELRDIARREMVWCENHRPAEKDCETMTLVSLLPDGRVRETGVMRLSRSPDVSLVIDGVSRLEGGRICSVYDDESLRLAFLMNGRPMPAPATRELEAAVRDAMEEFRGKTLCQSFHTAGGVDRLREEVTVDGVRRTDLESTYRLQADESGLDVRAPEEPEESRV